MEEARKQSETRAVWVIMLSGTLYGLLGFFGTSALKENLSIAAMLFWRFLIAAIWMSLWSSWRAKDLTQKKKFFPLLLSGIFYSGSSMFYFYASKGAGTGLAMVIFFSYPIFVALLICFKSFSHIDKYSVASLLAVSIGLYLLQKNNLSPIALTSILLALTASLSYAFYICQSKSLIMNIESGQFTLIISLISAAFFLVIAIFSHAMSIPHSFKGWSYLLGLGIIATALPIQLLLDGLKTVNSLKASLLSVLEPAVTLLIGVLALHEAISSSQLAGVLVIIVATFLIQLSKI